MSSTAIDTPTADRFLSGPWPRFLARRLLRLVVSLWVLVTFSFLIVHLVPGDPVRAALGARASAQSVAEWEARLGLNDPLPTQYADYVSGLAHGRLGDSLQLRLPVDQVIPSGCRTRWSWSRSPSCCACWSRSRSGRCWRSGRRTAVIAAASWASPRRRSC